MSKCSYAQSYRRNDFKVNKRLVAEEVKEIVFWMNPMSSPSPDGFNIGFYQTHWHIVGQDVCRAVLDFLNSADGDLSIINDTYIVLIPTKKLSK